MMLRNDTPSGALSACGSSHRVDQFAIRRWPAMLAELPQRAHLVDEAQVHVCNEELILVLARLRDDLAARTHEIARAVKAADVPWRLRAHAIDGPDEYIVGQRCGGLLDPPGVLTGSCDGGRRIDDVMRAVQRERTPALGKVTV